VLADTRREEVFGGARLLRLPPTGVTMSLGRWLMLPFAFWRLLREQEAYDIIFVDGFRTLGMVAVLAGRFTGKRVVFKPNSSGEMSGAFFRRRLIKSGATRWGDPLLQAVVAARNPLLRRADAFCPISNDIAGEFAMAGVPGEKIRLIANAFDEWRFLPRPPEEKARLRQRLGIPPQGVVAVFTGRMVSWKGPHLLVRIWKELAGRGVRPLLLLVGPPGNDIFDCDRQVREEIEAAGLQGSVRMTGGVDNVEDYLGAADLFVFCSQGEEGLPTTLIEAMACGLPSVTTRATGLNDLATPETALTVDMGDLAGFGAAVERLAGDPLLRQQLGQAAALQAHARYASARVNGAYLQLFRELLGSACPSAAEGAV
jgi:glycosyltransferase involved in cell wall biosynthesis